MLIILIVFQNKVRGVKGDSDGSNDEPNVRLVFFTSDEQARLVTLRKHGRCRDLHGCNYFNIGLYNDRAFRGQEFRCESQYFGLKYTNRVLFVWGFCSVSIQKRDKWRRELHWPKMLPNNFYSMGFFVCFGNFASFDPSCKN